MSEESEIIWTNVTYRIGDLKPWDKNPKFITKAHARRLLRIWKKFGQFQTIAIGPAGEVYDGHQRLSMLLAAYNKEYKIAARQSSRALTEDERKELTIAAHSGTTGQLDWEQLITWNEADLIQWGLDMDAQSAAGNDYGAITNLLAVAARSNGDEEESPFSEFGETNVNDEYVTFQFGDFRGRVEKEVYNNFLVAYKKVQAESGKPMISDVLRRWLNV